VVSVKVAVELSTAMAAQAAGEDEEMTPFFAAEVPTHCTDPFKRDCLTCSARQ